MLMSVFPHAVQEARLRVRLKRVLLSRSRLRTDDHCCEVSSLIFYCLLVEVLVAAVVLVAVVVLVVVVVVLVVVVLESVELVAVRGRWLDLVVFVER